jgi:hypothetical protein
MQEEGNYLRKLPASIARSILCFWSVYECGNSDFTVKLWNDTGFMLSSTSRFTLTIRDPHVLRILFSSPDELALGDAFVNGDLDVEGDLSAALQFGECDDWTRR